MKQALKKSGGFFYHYRFLFLFFFISINVFITIQGLLDADASSQVSSGVTEVIIDVVEGVIPPSQLTPDFYESIVIIVRKGIGHIGLNFVSGLFLMMTLLGFAESNRIEIYYFISGLLLSIYGESLQIFALGRGPMFEDIAYNFLGFLLAFILYYFLMNKKKVLR
jgi:VanZ family protein